MPERSATVQSFAKINLDLRVLYRRPDNFHELRSVFQTISLADTIQIRYQKARQTRLAIAGNVDIPDNLILRAARAVLDRARLAAEVTFTLTKRIPMGAGLGGGSSNAAAVLLALPCSRAPASRWTNSRRWAPHSAAMSRSSFTEAPRSVSAAVRSSTPCPIFRPGTV